MQEKTLRKDRPGFDGFCSQVEAELKKRLGESVRVEAKEVSKNNGMRLKGLNVCQRGSNVGMNFYLDFHYEEYVNGKSLTEIVDDIVGFCNDGMFAGHVDTRFFKEWESAKSRILFKLVNYEKNRELLLEVPHKRFLDLAIVYYVSVEELENATILIYNTHMELWGKTMEDIHKEAWNNTPSYRPCAIMDIASIMGEAGVEDEAGEDDGFMYIMTNSLKFFGASAVLYPDAVKDFAEKMGEDFFILPSSVHEVILVPSEGANPETLALMVRGVNQDAVIQEEYLSDSVYRFSRETGEITIAVEGGLDE